MAIHFLEKERMFHLQGGGVSYVIALEEQGYPAHVYWGKKLRDSSLSAMLGYKKYSAFSPKAPGAPGLSLDTLPQEYTAYGAGDYRHPAYQIQLENGSTVCVAVYSAHRIYAGKPKLDGLPATYVEQDDEARTLELELADEVAGLTITLLYTIFAESGALARSARLSNIGGQRLNVLRALSASVDVRPATELDMLHLHGAWARERSVDRRPLQHGITAIESRRGASGHMDNPFIALLASSADEHQGDVYGVNLVYSGSFAAQAEVEQYGTVRLSIGINPFDFSWLLMPGESFQTPEAIMVYAPDGLGGMSRIYHRLYRTRLCRGRFRDEPRPILINNWEGTYFDFDAEVIERIARAGSELGIELFVLDDGWFGKRSNDTSSLGDWFVNRDKLPEGMDGLGQRVRKLGMQFGLWFEPEMVSPDSELYRAHPDWCLHVPGRRRSEARNQLVLDFSRDDVCEEIVRQVSDMLRTAPITYVKWDMNRHMSEIGSALLPAERQRETAHRYMLGLYKVLERITGEFPHVLFESCSGGGGRFDPGILYYMPQTWTSDNTDAVSRLGIQYGTSIVYPLSSIGAHVSAVPNHQMHRMTSLDMRGDVAMSGNFGYELDLTKLSDEEKETVKKQVAFYKDIRGLVQTGDLYRLLSPFEGNETAWMIVAPDKSEAVVGWFRVLAQPNDAPSSLRLHGLDADADYELQGEAGERRVFGGDRLMYAGMPLPARRGDFASLFIHVKRLA